MKHAISACFLALFFIISCRQPVNKIVKRNDTGIKATPKWKIQKDTVVKKVYPLTDSGQLMLHLDSLLRPRFPYLSESGNYSHLTTISLSAFKNKKLFHIPVTLIPTQFGGGFLDHGEDLNDSGFLPDSIRETFDLVDTVQFNPNTYKVEGVLMATTPKFALIDLDGILVTLSYNLDVIDAIHSSEGAGNNHWQLNHSTTIYKDLTLVLHHSWTRPEMPEEKTKAKTKSGL